MEGILGDCLGMGLQWVGGTQIGPIGGLQPGGWLPLAPTVTAGLGVGDPDVCEPLQGTRMLVPIGNPEVHSVPKALRATGNPEVHGVPKTL